MAWDAGAEILYVCADFNLFRSDPKTGSLTSIGHTGNSIDGLAHAPDTDTLYASTGPELVILDRGTGSPTMIGDLGGRQCWALAYDSDAKVLYGVDRISDELLTIDTGSGLATAVGPIGFSAVYGLTYDHRERRLLATTLQTRELLVIDPATGAGSPIAPVQGRVRALAGPF